MEDNIESRKCFFKGGIAVTCLNDDGNDPIVKEKLIQEREENLVEQYPKIGEKK